MFRFSSDHSVNSSDIGLLDINWTSETDSKLIFVFRCVHSVGMVLDRINWNFKVLIKCKSETDS